MARAGRKDRGLLSKTNAAGETVWYVRVYHKGKEKQYGSFPTKTEAREKYESEKQEHRRARLFPDTYGARQQDTTPPPPPLLFKEYVTRWEAKQPMTGNKPTTIKTYHHRLEKRTLPAFGEQPIAAITRPQIKDWVASLVQEGLDYDTTAGYLLTLSGVLTEAVEDELIVVNPALHAGKIVKRPKTVEEQDLDIFTPEEEQTVLQAAKAFPPMVYPIVLTFFRTGMRVGEVLGLHRADVNFSARSIRIKRNWTKWHLTTPKNGKSRTVDLSHGLAAALRDWMAYQDLEAGAAGQPSPEILFPGNLGGTRQVPSYMAENWLRYTLWFPLLDKAQVRRLNLHATRHTFVSRLIANGENFKYIAEQVGHGSIKVTVDTYGRLLPGGNKQTVDRLDKLDPIPALQP